MERRVGAASVATVNARDGRVTACVFHSARVYVFIKEKESRESREKSGSSSGVWGG